MSPKAVFVVYRIGVKAARYDVIADSDWFWTFITGAYYLFIVDKVAWLIGILGITSSREGGT